MYLNSEASLYNLSICKARRYFTELLAIVDTDDRQLDKFFHSLYLFHL